MSLVIDLIYLVAKHKSGELRCPATALIELSCTQDFQILFSKGHNSEKGHNLGMKKNTGQLFFHKESVYEIIKP